ncbi:MAG: hypothetical protein NT144_12685 [Bacteroidia bacterium]|nr:hypothetical protein [Bacteroidia bacterium]
MEKKRSKLIPFFSENIFSARVLAFIILTLTAIILRLYISFSNDLILGVDGGYYPLQVRNILNNGHLAYNDVPIYFYFCAFVIKIASLFGLAIANESIILVIKIIDCIALPLLAVPVFKLASVKERHIPFFAEIAILFFAVFSFSPFIMLGDLQKNAFAIPFLFMFINFFENYLITHQKRNLLLALLTLFIIALTHFGVFVFGMAFLIISLFFVYRKKAILPSILTILIGVAVISVFDINRAFRLITFWNVIFENPALLQGPMPPPLLFNILFSYFLALFAIFQYRKYKKSNSGITGYMVLILAALISIFAFPFFDIEYFHRFEILLFIPQSLLILNLIRMNKNLAVPFSIIFVLMATFSISMNLREMKKPVIDNLALRDLQNIIKYIPVNTDSTIIIASHGLEFWTAWTLNVKVGNDRAMDKLVSDKFRNIIILQQKNEFRESPLGKRPLHKPIGSKGGFPPMGPPPGRSMGPPMGRPVPENFKLIYNSPFFIAYQNLN